MNGLEVRRYDEKSDSLLGALLRDNLSLDMSLDSDFSGYLYFKTWDKWFTLQEHF